MRRTILIVVMIIQSLFFILPTAWGFYIVDYELEVQQNFCTENYKEIFSNSEKDFINYERTNEDKIREKKDLYKDCERALIFPDYWKLTFILQFLIIGLMLQIFWLLWGMFYFEN